MQYLSLRFHSKHCTGCKLCTTCKVPLQQLPQLLNPWQNLLCHLLSDPFIFTKINHSLHICQALQKQLPP